MVALLFRNKSPLKAGFTLIELSIVLVIIGLVIGGVLVGQDLISSATIRAQISQIEKYRAAVNTFHGKYGYLPGDIPDPTATQYGFTARWINGGQGDGNGILEGVNSGGPNQHWPWMQGAGETVLFWRDLSDANLIDAAFSAANATAPPAGVPQGSMGQYLPPAKIGNNNYLFVYSGGLLAVQNFVANNYPVVGDGQNYFSLTQNPSEINSGQLLSPSPGLTVLQAYSMDVKMDDGLPQT
ncbi:MAG: prepilin-type N-terminal cleavage/methylation domain-containing protein, partial [Verrucomicrobiota bacterium]